MKRETTPRNFNEAKETQMTGKIFVKIQHNVTQRDSVIPPRSEVSQGLRRKTFPGTRKSLTIPTPQKRIEEIRKVTSMTSAKKKILIRNQEGITTILKETDRMMTYNGCLDPTSINPICLCKIGISGKFATVIQQAEQNLRGYH